MGHTTAAPSSSRVFLGENKALTSFPGLLDAQLQGFGSFVENHLPKLFADVSPIEDIAGDKLQLSIDDIKIGKPIHDMQTCQQKELTYGAIISAKVKLIDNKTGEVFFTKRANVGILPLATAGGSYVINGVERVIIHQIVRSYGLFFSRDKKTLQYSCKLIPEYGVWMELATEKSGAIIVRMNKSRKFPVTALLKVLGFENDQQIRDTFAGVLDEEDFDYIEATLEKDTTGDALDAATFIYNKLRPGEIIDPESALDYVKSLFLAERLYLGRIARRKVNAKLDIDHKDPKDTASHVFDIDDMIATLKYLISLANRKRNFYTDDIDHLSNRRVRSVGELLYAHLTPVMRRFTKSAKGKLSVLNTETPIKLTDLVNFKMIDNSIKSFFATSQLSQFLDQVNPLAEIEHKRRITALGPGGLKRETTTFEVRDVHQSHYGRICPIETPEGQNIGLVVNQALYSRINEDGFIETPGGVICRSVKATKKELLNRIAEDDIVDKKGNVIVPDGEYITADVLDDVIAAHKGKQIAVRPFISGEIDYISPERDEKSIIADATIDVDDAKNIIQKRVPARHLNEMGIFHINDVTHIDVNSSQLFSPNTSIIPFVDHDEAVRSAMGTNMQRQAVPLVKPEKPYVGTGLERAIAEMTYALVTAEQEGEVIYVDATRIKVSYVDGTIKEYELPVFKRSNQKTVVHQWPKVSLGQTVQPGDILAEGPSVVDGDIAIGKNIRVAFMPWKGYNYEDAIVISQRLVKDDELSSIYINEYEIEVADTKLGPEETTNDIPGVSLSKLADLDDQGIVRIGATVKGGDILVGKITPKSEGELAPEEKLIQAIFGDKSKSFRDTSLYLSSGSDGKVIGVNILDVKKGDNLPAGIKKKIKVYVARLRKIEVGDKMAGRHGNKGLVAIVAPEEDMPYDKDGNAVDIVLNPLGVISRMNIGQTLEMQLGMIAHVTGQHFAVPLFSGFEKETLSQMYVEQGLPDNGKFTLYDGKTGEPFDSPITVGYMYMLKLIHMVEDKIHARSVGSYSLITQQPLGGKAREGGQRFGEMEVWALEAYAAVHTLQEMLTIKSDDVVGRNKAYETIIKGGNISLVGIPESFNLLVYELKGLLQNVKPLTKIEIETKHQERVEKITKLGLKSLTSNQIVKEDMEKELQATPDDKEGKDQMIQNVIKDMEEYGVIDEE